MAGLVVIPRSGVFVKKDGNLVELEDWWNGKGARVYEMRRHWGCWQVGLWIEDLFPGNLLGGIQVKRYWQTEFSSFSEQKATAYMVQLVLEGKEVKWSQQ